jgi:hypothetical protein
MLLAKGLLSQQPHGAVGKEFSFFSNFEFKLFFKLATLFTSTWFNVSLFFATFSYISLIIFIHLNFLV